MEDKKTQESDLDQMGLCLLVHTERIASLLRKTEGPARGETLTMNPYTSQVWGLVLRKC